MSPMGFRPIPITQLILMRDICATPSDPIYSIVSNYVYSALHCTLDIVVSVRHWGNRYDVLYSVPVFDHLHYWTERIAHSIERLK